MAGDDNLRDLDPVERCLLEQSAPSRIDNVSLRGRHSDASYERILRNREKQSDERQPVCYGHCGSLGWTIVQHGRVTHKQSCPHRTEPWCQSHPDGCPDECVPLNWQEQRAV